MSAFNVQALRELTEQQTRYAPPARRQEQVGRAEKLLAELDPAKQYPYQWVCFRLTEYRSDTQPDLLIPGRRWRTTWPCSPGGWSGRSRPSPSSRRSSRSSHWTR